MEDSECFSTYVPKTMQADLSINFHCYIDDNEINSYRCGRLNLFCCNLFHLDRYQVESKISNSQVS